MQGSWVAIRKDIAVIALIPELLDILPHAVEDVEFVDERGNLFPLLGDRFIVATRAYCRASLVIS